MSPPKTPCPKCGSKHYFKAFSEADGCPSCDRSLSELMNLGSEQSEPEGDR